MKKDLPNWSGDTYSTRLTIWAWKALGLLVVILLLFWLAVIFGLVP